MYRFTIQTIFLPIHKRIKIRIGIHGNQQISSLFFENTEFFSLALSRSENLNLKTFD